MESLRATSTPGVEPHPEWGGDRNPVHGIEMGFVARSWLVCLLATAVLAALGTGFVALVSDTPLTGETNTELGVLTIVSAFATFLGFAVAMSVMLTRVAHDRLANSMAVAGLHVAVAVALFAVNLLVRALTGTDAGSVFDGPWTDEVGNAFTVLERSAVAAIGACLLAAGMVPARGERPARTQTQQAPTDYQL
ncbi:MAG: hypothetical protein JWM86_2247 [Thermoleophilia bacterium]|nr:hypothetical protein [Thermoleophilia bacterium]